jgi:hypothetical protein
MSVRIMGHAPARVYRPIAKRTTGRRNMMNNVKKVLPKRKVSALDAISTSPKIAEKIKNAEKVKQKTKPKEKKPRRDPLKEVRA